MACMSKQAGTGDNTVTTAPTVEPEASDTPAADETSATNETPPEPEAPVQPAEIDEQAAEIAEGGKAIELHTPHGHLTLRPNQDQLDPGQHAGLLAIGIDVQHDPGVWPHLRVFIHMCQRKNLDPYAREAYLIGRGRGEYRRWTMQTSIEGYRKMAGMTGRFVRVAGTYWTWQDDKDGAWWEDPEGIMRRRWFDQWPDSRDDPGAARVVIEHYDEARRLTRTEAVGNWGMFAPYTDKYDGSGQNRRKVHDADGNPVRVLGEFWVKGGPHMLAKCLPAYTRIQTDRGSLFIKDIVQQRLPVKVRSVDLVTGEECWQSVVNWWTNGVTREWVAIRTPNGGRGNRSLRTTPDHPFWTPLGWKDAGDLTRADTVAVTSPTLSSEQDQVIRGGLLGDGTLTGRKRDSTLPHYAEAHSIRQADYLRWKVEALTNLSPTVDEVMQTDGAGGSHSTIKMRTRAVPALYGYRRQKPQELLDGLDDLGLAVWFMDDGAFHDTKVGTSRRPRASIHCCGFPVEFADHAVAWFAARNIVSQVLRRDKNPYLSFGVEATTALLARLAPYLTREGNRKVWHADSITERGSETGYVFVPVLDVEQVTRRKGGMRYDIEVEGTHTFVVNNVVVSNCTEALGHRQAFPAGMGGFYVQEEMSRLDQAEKDRQADELARKRTEAFEAAQTREQITVNGSTEPVRAGEVAQQVIETVRDAQATPAQTAAPDARADDETRAAWLRAEIEEQARILGKTVAALMTRQVRALRKNYDDFTVAELATAAHRMREHVVAKLREAARPDEADAYAIVQEGQAFDVDTLFGRVPDSAVYDPANLASGAVAEDLAPGAPHEYVDKGGVCGVCELFEDEAPHPGAAAVPETSEG
jgi:hypothetical protein